MRTRFLSIIINVSVAAALNACGPAAKEREALESSDVRLHRRFSQEPATGFGLVASYPEIIKRENLASSSLASWILYDSRQMPIIPQQDASSLLRSWLDAYGELIAADGADEWRPVAEGGRTLNDFYRSYAYQRFVAGLPVRDNQLQLIVSRATEGRWRLAEVIANATGPILQAIAPQALDDAELHARFGDEEVQVESKAVEWIPFMDASGFHHEAATSFHIIDAAGESRVVTLLHANAQAIEDYPLSLHLKSIQARALKRSYRDAGPREYPLAFATAFLPAKASGLGAEALIAGDTAPQAVGLQGPRAIINDAQGQVPIVAGLSDVGDAFLVNSQSYEFAAVNAFVSVQRINRFVRQFIDPDEVDFLDDPVRVVVNSGDGSCNAFYSPKAQRILLYKEDADCANMALLNDVIFHEWGHALDDHLGQTPGIVDYAFSEGIADTLAAFYNEDPEIAAGFYFNDPRGVRNVASERIFPRDKGSAHFEGGIISGAFWDLRAGLIAAEGARRGSYLATQLFLRHLLSVDSYAESYAAVLRLDDDDGRPETPSPHACLIQKAFSQHGLAPAPSVPCASEPAAVVAVDRTLQMNVWEDPSSPKQIRLIVSSPDASQVAYCWTTRERCVADPSQRRMLDVLPGSASFHFFGSPILRFPARLNALTLLSYDAAGAVQGARQFVVHDK